MTDPSCGNGTACSMISGNISLYEAFVLNSEEIKIQKSGLYKTSMEWQGKNKGLHCNPKSETRSTYFQRIS